MIAFVALCAPIFGVVALGWAAMRMRFVTVSVLDALAAFSFRFALPALVFRLVAGQPLSRSFDPVFYAGYLASGGIVFALAFGLSRLLDRRDVGAAAARATTATVGNLGFLGPPLMLAFFGERGTAPLTMAILAEIMVLLCLGGAIMGAAGEGRSGVGSLVLRGTVLNPVGAAIVLSAILAATGVQVPGMLDRFLEVLGSAAAPTALFAVGGALAVQRFDRTTIFAAVGIVTTKLVIYPAIVWCVLGCLLRVPLFWTEAGVVLASLPTTGNVYVLAQRYGADAERISAAIALSTVVSVVTLPFAAWLMLR